MHTRVRRLRRTGAGLLGLAVIGMAGVDSSWAGPQGPTTVRIVEDPAGGDDARPADSA